MSSKRTERGYTLLEMVVLISLLGVFLLVGSELWRVTTLTTRNARQVETDAVRIEMVLDRLRRDAWSAQRVESHADGCRLQMADGREIEWRVTDGVQLVRSVRAEGAAEQSQAWPIFAERVSFGGGGDTVHVTLTPPKGPAAPPMLFVAPGATKGGRP